MPEQPLKSVDRNSTAFLEMRREQAKVDLMNKIQELGGTNGVSQWRSEHRGQPVDLAGQNLEGIDFRGADLDGANCAGANFEMASLRLACFIGTKLDGASFDSVTDIRGANFQAAQGLSEELQNRIITTLTVGWSAGRAQGQLRNEAVLRVRYDVTFPHR